MIEKLKGEKGTDSSTLEIVMDKNGIVWMRETEVVNGEKRVMHSLALKQDGSSLRELSMLVIV